MAKRLLDEKGLTYEEIDIEEKDGAGKIYLQNGGRTVPQIVMEGKSMGMMIWFFWRIKAYYNID